MVKKRENAKLKFSDFTNNRNNS